MFHGAKRRCWIFSSAGCPNRCAGIMREWRNDYSAQTIERNGGPGRVRTVDLFHAMEARSQLRHRPIFAADRQVPDRETRSLAGTRLRKALQGYWSVTEYSTPARRSAN